MRKLFLMVFVFLSVFANAQVLKVGMSPDYPPFDYMKDGKFAGVDADVINALSTNLGFKYEFVSLPFSELETSLANGSIDMIASAMTSTPERKSKFGVSEPYFLSADMFVALSDRKDLVNKESLEGKTIAVVNKDSHQEKLANSIKGAKVLVNDSIVNAIILVKTERADAMIIDSLNLPVVFDNDFEYMSTIDKNTIAMIQSLGIDKKLDIFYTEFNSGGNIVVLFSKSVNPDFITQVNQEIKNLKTSGEMGKILAKYGLR
ncbi:substrate-binding periplasmic protein [Campylobacter geochelonis]|uniref:substrate-binding periplasmic protein n=1 Tax=Campylobacter geochelonis TaxID=1780362 RepID=UPI00077097AC|nr:transporter substrate-binding domain-containing protein [Campylobacter geochelonis]CZE49699.1 CjaC [Campylobacter geochelonis]